MGCFTVWHDAVEFVGGAVSLSGMSVESVGGAVSLSGMSVESVGGAVSLSGMTVLIRGSVWWGGGGGAAVGGWGTVSLSGMPMT